MQDGLLGCSWLLWAVILHTFGVQVVSYTSSVLQDDIGKHVVL